MLSKFHFIYGRPNSKGSFWDKKVANTIVPLFWEKKPRGRHSWQGNQQGKEKFKPKKFAVSKLPCHINTATKGKNQWKMAKLWLCSKRVRLYKRLIWVQMKNNIKFFVKATRLFFFNSFVVLQYNCRCPWPPKTSVMDQYKTLRKRTSTLASGKKTTPFRGVHGPNHS